MAHVDQSTNTPTMMKSHASNRADAKHPEEPCQIASTSSGKKLQ
jgi:hypothetical protein